MLFEILIFDNHSELREHYNTIGILAMKIMNCYYNDRIEFTLVTHLII